MSGYLGIDVGTSAVKAVLADEAGVVLERHSIPISAERPRHAWVEQSPDELRSAVKAIGAYFGHAGIAAVGLVGQTPSLVFVGPDGAALGPILIWQDTRAVEEAQELSGLDSRDLIGIDLPWSAAYPPAKLLWLSRNQPDLVAATDVILQPKDYVGLLLTGSPLSDRWSSKGLCRVDDGEPARNLLERVGWRDKVSPPTAAPWSIRGTISQGGAEFSGLQPGTVVAVGWSDALAAMLAVGAFHEPTAFVLAGTSDIVGRSLRKLPQDTRPLLAIPDSIAPLPVVYGPTSASGASLSWCARIVAGVSTEVLDRIDEPSANSPVFLPYLQGERAPIWRDDVRGAFFGLDIACEPADLATAVAFGVASSGRHVLEAVNAPGEVETDVVVAAGRGATETGMSLARAAIHGCELRRIEEPDVSALGAAMLGAAAFEAEPPARVAARMLPRSSAVRATHSAIAQADAYYARYLSASAAVQRWQ